MKPHRIHTLIAQGEHQRLDFKFEISDARKIARTFSAFANTDGGTLLIGVRDDGTISGIRTEEEKFMADVAANRYCKPEVDFVSREWGINSKKVLEIKVVPGLNQPYLAETEEGKWRAYIRVKDENILANKIIVNAMKQKNSDAGTYIIYTENEKLLLQYLEDNESVSFSKFRKMAKISPYKAEKILTNFLALEVIEVVILDKNILYQLSEKFKIESF